jgi:phosphoribosyl 1,2-cyclic phosphodiesterase
MLDLDFHPPFSVRKGHDESTSSSMPLNVQILGSSSAGNCTLVWTGRSAVLVDFGFGPRFIGEGLQRNSLTWTDLTAVVLTHTHGDHIDFHSLKKLTEHKVPVIAPTSVLQVVRRNFRSAVGPAGGSLRTFPKSRELEVGSFHFRAFEVPHDSPGGCFGYRITALAESGPRTLAIATDLGYADGGLPMEFAGCDLLVIESNHDPDMLENSSRPSWLKNRIREIGHLSNPQSATLVGEILARSQRSPKSVLLAHLSQECNTEPIASRTMEAALRDYGFGHIPIDVSHPDRASATILAH